MSNDEKIQNTVEQAITGLRGQLEGELRAFVGQLERAGVEERNRVVAQAVEAASEQLRKESETRLTQVREAAQREVEELRREGERRADAHQREIAELRASAAEEAETLRREVGRQTQAHQHEIDEARATAAAEADRLRREAGEQAQAHQRELMGARQTATSEAEARLTQKLAAVSEEHRRELSAAGAKVESLVAEMNEIRAAAADAERRVSAQLAVAIDDRERERRESAATLDGLNRELSEARAAAAAAAEGRQHDQASAESTIAKLTRQVDDVRRSLTAETEERLGAELAVAAAQHERALKEGVEQARDDGRQEEAARVARLEHAVHTLDDARTLSTALEELGRCAAREADRAAILLLKSGRIQGWRLFGFGDVAPKSIDLDLENAGIVGEVVRSGEARHGARLPVPAFAQGGEPREVCALPVIVGWTVVAVLYADAPVGAPASGWPTLLDVLARHASKVLETTTLQQAIGLSTSAPAGGAATGGAASGPQQPSLQ